MSEEKRTANVDPQPTVRSRLNTLGLMLLVFVGACGQPIEGAFEGAPDSGERSGSVDADSWIAADAESGVDANNAMDGSVVSDSGAVADAQADASVRSDGGGPVDAEVDAGLGADGGDDIDGGMGVDGGADPDAGSGVDAGPAPDAGAGGVPGGDVTQPFPIDRGDDGAQTPGTYKGLPLRLVDTGAPVVTPVNGVIGVVCIGMSNATQECGNFIGKLGNVFAGTFNAEVRVVDCAVGGNAIERWNSPSNDGNLWDACINTKLGQANVLAEQVRVVYHKAADQFTTDGGNPLPLYPTAGSDYDNFQANLTTFADRVNAKFPSVQAVYTTSRTFGGFSTNPGRGEPLSYEEGQALNQWLALHPQVGGVWHGWGPYIWGPDCASGNTNGSGVCYVQSDFQADGVHPATGARDKISQMIHDRFLQHAWYQP